MDLQLFHDEAEWERARTIISARQCKAVRAWLGYSQKQFAKRAGVDPQTVMHFEIGRHEPRKATVLALVMALLQEGCQVDREGNLTLPPVPKHQPGVAMTKP